MLIPQTVFPYVQIQNDQLLAENSQYRFSEDNRKLLITYFLDGDSGRYTCAARNRVGMAEKHVDIKIIGYNSSDTSCGPHVIQSKCSQPIEVEFPQASGKGGRDWSAQRLSSLS